MIPIQKRLEGTQTGTGYQNKRAPKCRVFKLKELAILILICFDTPLGAAKETPKRVQQQTGTKIPLLFFFH